MVASTLVLFRGAHQSSYSREIVRAARHCYLGYFPSSEDYTRLKSLRKGAAQPHEFCCTNAIQQGSRSRLVPLRKWTVEPSNHTSRGLGQHDPSSWPHSTAAERGL